MSSSCTTVLFLTHSKLEVLVRSPVSLKLKTHLKPLNGDFCICHLIPFFWAMHFKYLYFYKLLRFNCQSLNKYVYIVYTRLGSYSLKTFKLLLISYRSLYIFKQFRRYVLNFQNYQNLQKSEFCRNENCNMIISYQYFTI